MRQGCRVYDNPKPERGLKPETYGRFARGIISITRADKEEKAGMGMCCICVGGAKCSYRV